MPHLAERTLEAAGIGGWELDVETGGLRWTAVVFRILELDPSQPPSLEAAIEVYAPLAQSAIRAAIAAAITDGTPWDLELPVVTARGRHIWVRVRGQALREDGQTTQIYGVFEDITASRELAERERLLSMVAAQMTNAVMTMDPDGRILWVNDAFTRITGYTLAEARLRMPDDLLGGPETDRKTVEHMLRCRREGRGYQVEVLNHDKAGRIRWMSVHGSPMRDATGKLTSYISVESDITERRAAEDAARREAGERKRAEVLLRDVLDTLPIAVIAYDANERVILSNRAHMEMAPISGRFTVPGAALEDIMRLAAEHGQFAGVPEAPQARQAWLAAVMARIREWSGQPRMLRMADGRVNQIRERRSEHGNLVVVRTDITELDEAQEKLRREAAERARAEALLRDVLDALPNAVVAYDSDERLLLTNRANAVFAPIGTRLSVVGAKMADVFAGAARAGQYADTPADSGAREAWIADMLAALRNPAGPRIMRMADGRVLELSATRSASGNLVIVRTDTTETHRAQALLRDVLDTLTSAVSAYDEEDRLILVNRAYGELLPITGRFARPGTKLADVIRLGAAHGQYADAPADPDAFETWLAGSLDSIRAGSTHTMRLTDGRVLRMGARRSGSGTMVNVMSDVTDLTRTQALLRDVIDTVPSAIIAFDSDDRVILTNRAFLDLYPVTARFSAPGRAMDEMFRLAAGAGLYADKPDDPQAVERWIEEALNILRSGVVHTVPLSDGRFVQMGGRRSPNGTLVSVRTETTDLVRAQALLRDVLEALPSAVTAYDREERLILTNPAYFEMFPIAARFAAIGERLEDTLRQAAEHGQFPNSGTTPEERAAWLAKRMQAHRNPGPPRTVPLPGGRFVQARESRAKSGITVAIRTDATDLVCAETKMRMLAESDTLTGLANRPAFLAALDTALSQAGGETGAGGAVLLFDIDYFKQINDTLGHDMGDALLIEVARRLRQQLRAGDLPARLGGDEFGVVMPGLCDPPSLASRMDVIHAALSAPFELAGRLLPIGMSAGVTAFPADGTEPSRLLKNADLALYEAKRHGRGRWAPFRPEQAAALEHHNRLADALREALARGQLTVALQPKRRLSDGRHDGFEALARWHDGAGWVPPAEFIPVAEQSGLIGPLGRAIMDAALERARDLRDLGLDPGRVAVNVTAPQLLDTRFKDDVLAALGRHGLQPGDLELEVTETVLLGRAAERIDTVLRDFSDLGITLALDDFGTGYASLAHLSRLPIDRLKIDRSFVIGIGTGGAGGVIARTVISLARSLEMQSIAEGIETQEQLAFLQAAGCDAGQGYLFARPLLTVQEAATYLRGQGTQKNREKRPVARLG